MEPIWSMLQIRSTSTFSRRSGANGLRDIKSKDRASIFSCLDSKPSLAAFRETAAMAAPYPEKDVSPFTQGTADAALTPVIRNITFADLHDALRLGWDDFKAVPSHPVILCLYVIYPVLSLVLVGMILGYSVLPLLFPLVAGFALMGPFAALGLCELSRRRELGEATSARHAAQVLRSPSFAAMLGLGTLLLMIFVIWVATAQAIYVSTFGNAPPTGIPNFVTRVLTTPEGWELIVVGCGVGLSLI